MCRKLYIGFKGKHNVSSNLVKSISADAYLLTNSFGGLKRDIESLKLPYDCVFLFGIDKDLRNTVRIDRIAEKETKESSIINLEDLSAQLTAVGISNYLSDQPTRYLCNDAYWYLLRKYHRKAVLIHIPSGKNMNEHLFNGLKLVFAGFKLEG